jgi:hypothetical protein
VRHEKGATLIEVVMITAIIGITASIAIPSLTRTYTSKEFTHFFGIQVLRSPSKEELLILQPLVTRRLQELEAVSDAQEKELLALPPATTPEEARARLAKLRDIQNRVEYLARARSAAKYFGFRIE